MKTLLIILCLVFYPEFSFGNPSSEDERMQPHQRRQAPAQRPQGAVSRGQKVDTSSMRERYWTAGGEEDTRVIQNRAYVKQNRLELGLFYGSTNTDPFVKVNQLGGSLGYFFTEHMGVRGLFWTHFSRRSSAHEQFDDQVRGAQILITNHPKYFYGGEFVFSPLYGKLSLMGRLIIYYDFYLMLGLGMTRTEIKQHITPLGGIGQHVFLTQWLTLNMNYRMTYYKESVAGKERARWDDVVNIGFNFLLF